MIVKPLIEHHLEFLSLKEGCTGSSESTLVKMPHCWESHVTAQFGLLCCCFLFQLSWGGASPLLSDRRLYPRFFRIAAPDTRFNYARIELARLFNWKKIATIHVSLDYFSAVRSVVFITTFIVVANHIK